MSDKTTDTKTHKRHRMYPRYSGMRGRVLSPTNRSYKDYGGRGITIYPEWVESYTGFLKYVEYVESLPNAHMEGYTLDRIDNDGNYEPSNLRWADNTTQVINRRWKSNVYKAVERLVEQFMPRGTNVYQVTEQIMAILRPVVPVIPEGHRQCRNCEMVKPIDEFQQDKSCLDGYRYRCLICTSNQHKELRERRQ